ncbi:MAG: hypothetical protein HOD92_25290 [Deltaproteobacteria bacterium]|jgi:hypothetical protein|nr:hypothetical protein [Deltaproteobacteria bacterium]
MKRYRCNLIKTAKILSALLIFICVTVFLNVILFAGNERESDLVHINLPENLGPEKIILKVEGKINKANPAYFDLETIKKFPAVSFKSFDPWDKKKRIYEGVRIIDLITFLKIDNSVTRIEVIAKNNYKAVISVKDLRKFNHILSYKMDDQYYNKLSGKENKGPLSVAINFDAQADIDIDIYKHQVVWWVSRIIVK